MPLLTTKFHIHPVRPKSVRRPRLVERLNAGLDNKLSVISAPPGFGKTSLISEWVGDLQGISTGETQKKLRITWLSLDVNDNDYVGFFTYFIGALRSIDVENDRYLRLGLGAMERLELPQPPSAEELLAELLNQITALPDRIVLVLDDYHVIETAVVNDALTFLIEHLPENMHMVIATREDPPIPLGRLRVRNQMTELRAADLRFTIAEVEAFLNQTMDLGLSAEEIAALEARTEGWVAGLQLAAVSLEGSDDAAGLIATFTGNHRHVVDFLLEEVLLRQSAEIQRFLLQTSILGRLCGSLCDALTGRDDGEARLEALERANIFVISLDDRRHWFRYHHLFADLLLQQLRGDQGDEVAALHRSAGVWFSEKGFFDEAIEHALEGGDFDHAAGLIEEQCEGKWESGNISCCRWTDRLPDDLIMARPFLCILQAYYLCTSGGKSEKIQRCLDAAEHLSESGSGSTSVLRGRLAAVRAFIDGYRGNLAGIIQHAEKALKLLPESDAMWRSLVSLTIGDIHGYRGDMAAALTARSEALAACKAAGSIYHTIGASLKVAITVREQGGLRRTGDMCRQQIALAGRNGLSESILSGWAQAVLGESLAEMNQLKQGMELADRGYRLAKNSYNLAVIGWVTACHIRVLYTSGNYSEAQQVIEETLSPVRGSTLPHWVISQMKAWQAKLWIRLGKMDAASELLEQRRLIAGDRVTLPEHLDFFSMGDYIVTARYLLAVSRLKESSELLDVLLEHAERGQRVTNMIEILLLRALVFRGLNSTAEAFAAIERALDLSEPEGFIRIFIDEGPKLARLLYEGTTRGDMTSYANRVLTSFPAVQLPTAPAADMKNPGDRSLEPLSSRELEVLHLIGEGHSNQDIGDRLFISLHTVKAHTRNIYAKIDAHSRTEAVAKGRAFGLLSPTPPNSPDVG
jgi:LuxR family transcriptional regulator, maltose regulon positive regulatory protein